MASGVRTSNTPTSPLKPGFGASLPVGLTKRATPSVTPSLKEGTTYPSRTSEVKSLSESESGSRTTELPTKPCFDSVLLEQEASKGDGNRVMSSVQSAVSDDAKHEIKEEKSAQNKRVTLPRDGEKEAGRPCVSSGSISEENEPGVLSRDESGENGMLISRSDSEAAENDYPVATEIVSMSPSSLYANNADIKKFLNEQSMEEGDQADSVSTSEETKSPMKRSNDSTSEPELESPKDKARNREDTDDEADDVFSSSYNQAERKDKAETEVRPPAVPVLRRPSHPLIPAIVEPPQAEPAAVELDADFCHEPIPNLPHPCLEENWSSAFLEMRAILSTNSMGQKENSALTYIFKEQQGCAVDSLKHFLKNIECG